LTISRIELSAPVKQAPMARISKMASALVLVPGFPASPSGESISCMIPARTIGAPARKPR